MCEDLVVNLYRVVVVIVDVDDSVIQVCILFLFEICGP